MTFWVLSMIKARCVEGFQTLFLVAVLKEARLSVDPLPPPENYLVCSTALLCLFPLVLNSDGDKRLLHLMVAGVHA